MLREFDWMIIMKHVLSVFLVAAWTVVSVAQVQNPSDKSEIVAMRLIGHKLLSCIGDDSSRVSAISQNDQSYTIAFEQSLSIKPTDLELIVSEVISTHHIADDYWVEVFRIHRSFIVNLDHITAFTSLDVEIGTKEISIGKSYKSSVSARLRE